MTAHLLIMYPHPKDAKEFDRAYREEHLPYAGPRLKGATSVVTKRVVGAAPAKACRSDSGEALGVTPCHSKRPSASEPYGRPGLEPLCFACTNDL